MRLSFSAIIGAYAKSKEPDKTKAVLFNAINDARSAWKSKSKTDDSTRLALWWPTARLATKPSARFMSDHL